MRIVIDMPRRPYNLDELMLAIQEGMPLDEVLDGIKEEIRNMSSELTRDGRRMIRKMRVLEIIDKYKKETKCEK